MNDELELSPMHTAEHLLNRTMGVMFGCPRSRNAHIERRKSKMNFLLDAAPTAQEIADIERRMNELITADLPVTAETVARADVPADVPLDALPDDVGDALRLVRIGDYDVCACRGRHVESTSRLGRFVITSTSYAEGSFRIVFRLRAE